MSETSITVPAAALQRLSNTSKVELIDAIAASGGSVTDAGPSEALQSAGNEFLLEKYKADREHELELNKASAAYEQAILRTLMVLNGASAAAFLTLLGAVWKADQQANLDVSRGLHAVGMWTLGLVLTAITGHQAMVAQQRYAKAYRRRRQAEELRRVDEMGVGEDWRQLFGIGRKPSKYAPGVSRRATAQSLAEKATRRRSGAKAPGVRSQLLGFMAVATFVLGVMLAATAFHAPDKAQSNAKRSAAAAVAAP